MDPVQFEPRITTDLQIDWRRHSAGQGADPFSDLLADQLKKRADSGQPDITARRRPQAADPVSGRPPRIVIAHARTLRGEAKEIDNPDDRRLPDHTDRAGDEGCPAAVEETAAPEESAAGADTPEQDDTAEAQTDTEAAASAEQPVAVAKDQVQPADPAAIIVVVTQPAEQPATGGEPDVTMTLPIPMPPEGEIAAPVQADQAANASPDGAQTKTDTDTETETEQQAVAAMAEAGLSEVAATLIGGEAAPADATEPAPAVTQQAPLPIALTESEQPLLQMPQAPAPVAELAPAQPKSERPAMDIKLRSGTPPRAHASAPDPTPSSAAAPQSAQPQHTTLLQPAAGESSGTGEAFDQPLSADGAGPGWALHLAQGAAGKRADFVAQLRQHLQNLPAHEQVAVHIQRAMREGTGKFSIQLSPAELGNIHVKLEIDEEKRVTAAVTVERPSTLELLQRDIKGLERALHNAGLSMEGGDLSFSLGRGDQDFAQDLNQSGASAAGGTVSEAQSEGELPDSAAAQVTDTAAGIVNLQV